MADANSPERYKLSFSAGGLFLQNASTVATLYRSENDWNKVRVDLDANNLLQARTKSSAQRLGWELIERLKELTNAELDLLIDSAIDERAQLLWVSLCRRYELIAEFAEEVLRERFLIMANDITPEHFDAFIAGKSLWHPELSDLKESTLKKLRSTLFLIMREAELITEQGMIIPVQLSARVRAELVKRRPSDIRFFPSRDSL